VLDPASLRWISFGHLESDEAGSMNDWLDVAPGAEVVFNGLGCMVSLNDLCRRPPHIAGTDPYIAPEECRRETVGTAADVFSLGVTLYEMLTGALPFGEPTRRRPFPQIDKAPLSMRRHRRGIAARLDALVLRCLAPDPADRPTIGTLLPALHVYQLALEAVGLAAVRVGAAGLQLARARPVLQLPGFADGECSVQDAAAQMAAPLLLEGMLPAAGAAPLRVLDACAAPGGKTAHLLEFAGPEAVEVTALEVDAVRSRRIDETLSRLGLSAKVLVADAARPSAWWDGTPFDAILLDAPCTASGIVRRHPDVRWLRRESDTSQLAVQQAALLAALWPLVKPGGRLLYCTCSVFREEGSQQIDAFLAHNTDARLKASPGHLLPQSGANARAVPDNASGDHDGFFYALLEKRPR